MWWLLACFDDSEGLAPSAPDAPPDRPELAPLQGRWSPVVAGPDGAWAVSAACPDANPPFVEIRADAQDGWQLMTGGADALQILPIAKVEAAADHVTIGIDGDPPVELVWVDPGKIARFPTLYAETAFVVPSARGSLPAAPGSCP